MFSVKILTAVVLLAVTSAGLHAQAAGAAQEVKKSAQAAAQASAPSAKPADKSQAQSTPKGAPSTTRPKATPQATGKPQAAAAKPAAPQQAQSQPGKPAAPRPTPLVPAKPGTPTGAVANPAVKPEGKTAAKKSGKPKASARSAAKKPAAKKPAPRKSTASTGGLTAETRIARRDPFESLVGRESGGGGPSGPLPAGKAGLQVSTLRLDGVVKAPNGMIAVVSNPQSRTYFLREGDQLYDGRVEKIAMDGVSFHEIGKDAFGKPVERQVNKRIYASAGEQQ
jgi:hypothetical protein